MAALFQLTAHSMDKTDVLNLSTCRNITEDEAKAFEYIAAKRIFITIIVPFCAGFGIFANSAFLFVIYRIPYMRTTTNFYLANLAVSDGLLLIVTSLRYMWTYYDSPTIDFKYGTPFYKTTGCVIPVLLTSFFNFTSVFFVTWVAFERYNAVCRPLYYRGRTGQLQAIKLTTIAWILTFVYVSPHGISISLKNLCWRWPSNETNDNLIQIMSYCKWGKWAIVSISLFDLGQFFLAFIANCSMYLKIVRKLNERRRKERNMVLISNHVARMLVINALVFFACLAPYQLVNIADVVEMSTQVSMYKGNVYNLFVWIGRVAFLLNSAINPVIYNVSNPDYRYAFMCTFCCVKRPTSQTGFGRIKDVKRLEHEMDQMGNIEEL